MKTTAEIPQRRWSIRNQILIPILTIQVMTILGIGFYSGWKSIRQVDEVVLQRITQVMTNVESATFPLTESVLFQLNQLTAAHFIVLNQADELVASTMSELSQDALSMLPEQTAAVSYESLSEFPRIQVDQNDYIVGTVRLKQDLPQQRVIVLYSEQLLKTARLQAIVSPLSMGTVLLFLTTFTTKVISNRFSNRINRVEQHVSRIAGGDYSPIPVPTTNDEIRSLTTSVNDMAAVLNHLEKRVRQQERMALLGQLVGGVAHQLRNSLTGARVSLQLHQQSCENSSDSAIQVALNQLSLTEEQIKSMLKLTQGESSPQRAGELKEIVSEAARLIEPLCKHQKIKFEREIEEVSCTVSDSDAIRGAVLNLLMNAIEAAGPNGLVQLRVTHAAEFIVIEVVDDGPGISENIQETIFDPFVTTKPEGAGLGLALAKQAAEACQGSLTVKAGTLTTFRMSLRKDSVA